MKNYIVLHAMGGGGVIVLLVSLLVLKIRLSLWRKLQLFFAMFDARQNSSQMSTVKMATTPPPRVSFEYFVTDH